MYKDKHVVRHNAKLIAVLFFMYAAMSSRLIADGDRARYTSDIISQSAGIRFFRQPDGAEISRYEMSRSPNLGGDVALVHNLSVNANLVYSLDFHSWTIAGTNVSATATGPWVGDVGSVSLGGGGLVMAANNIWRFGNKETSAVRVKLKESQTWSGPESGSSWAMFSIGCKEQYNGYYWQSRISALENLTWTLTGRLQVILTDANDLSNVDVVVMPLARLVLVKGWSTQTFNGKLGAKSLTLKGGDASSDKALFTIGAANPSMLSFGDTIAPDTFDATTVAATVTLLDGASIVGGMVAYSVPQLNVESGDSTFSGNVTLNESVAIDIGKDATFAFTGNLFADEGAVLTINGEGRFLLPASGLSVPVAGAGVIVVDPGEGNELVLHNDLSEFTGKISVLSGTLLLHEDSRLSEYATVETSEGASWRVFHSAEAGDFTDIDTGYTYYRAPDGSRHQYLYANQFTANTSSLTYRRKRNEAESIAWMDGSIMVFDTANSGGVNMSSAHSIYGFVAEQEWKGSSYVSGSGVLTFGGKGIHGDYGISNNGFNFWKDDSRVKLSESQSWTGPNRERSSNTQPFRIDLGSSGTYSGSLTALEDGLTLAVAQDALLRIFWPTNSIANANLHVKYPALLCLASYTKNGDALHGRLNADTLTLEGGECLYCGADNYALRTTYVQSPTNVTADTYARKIVLKDGGVLKARTRTLWHDVTLAAKGLGNKLDGAFEFQNQETAIEVGEGSVLDLADSVALTEKSGVSAALNVKGAGTVKVNAGTYSLTGGIDLKGSTLQVSGAPAIDVSGVGTVDGDIAMNRFAVDAAAEGVLAFNGTLTVGANPVVLLRNLPEKIKNGYRIVFGSVCTIVGRANLANAVFAGDAIPEGMPVKVKVDNGSQLCVCFGNVGLAIIVR